MSTQETVLETVRSMIDDSLMEGSEQDIASVQTFEDAGILSYNPGIVVICKDGRRYTLTISEGRG